MAATAWPRQMRINGGSRETEVKLLTVSPCGAPLESSTLAIVTPVAKRPQARRNSSLLTGVPRPGYLSLDMGINSILSCG
jgi:tetrahydromethanopterin S-methyltransferase subunit C